MTHIRFQSSMDLDQGTRRFTQERFKVKDPNYYDYESKFDEYFQYIHYKKMKLLL